MYTSNKILRFSAIALAAALIFFTPVNSRAAEGRLGNYSLLSGHGGYNTVGKGVLRLAGYAAGNCGNCHEQHASVGGTPTAPFGSLLFDTLTGNALCNFCHDSTQSNGADNIVQQISKGYSHDPASTITTVLCVDCHDSHEATRVTHSEAVDGNAVSGALAGVSGTDPVWINPAAPTEGGESINNPTSLTPVDPATLEYQICLKCHGGQFVTEGLADIGRQFNPNFAATHPVTTSAWKNTFLVNNAATAMKAPWQTADTQMYCSDCHAGETTLEPVGPHGSANIYLLREVISGASPDNLCETCHNVSPTNGGASNWVSENAALGYPPNRDHDYGPHQYPANALGCVACHGGVGDASLESSIHGANYRGNVNNAGTDVGRRSRTFLFNSSLITKIYYTDNSNGEAADDVQGNRYCAATCHTTDGGIGHRF
ncbi:MAG: hypothetical protein KKG47_07940 [Proteobacteria bacterium]|nr:hypothetical protein [Pseudomonadota bacterium]MBU1738229.1 hypothetical protein [Pseudomonadota bacterium]